MKKSKQTLILLAGLLLATSLTLSACNNQKDPSTDTDGDTTVADTGSVTDPSDHETNDDPTQTTTPITETVTDPASDTDPSETDPVETPSDPNELTAEELKTLLAAAFEANMQATDRTKTVKTLINGEEVSVNTLTQKGEDFHCVISSMGSVEDLIVLGDQAYYILSYDDGEYAEQYAYLVTLTAEQKQELYALYVGDEDTTGSDELYDGILAGTLTGNRNDDGTISISSTELDASLTTLLMGEEMEDAELSFDFTLSSEGLLSFMRFTVTIPADMMFGEAYTISSERTVESGEPVVQAPADTSAYVEATYEEVFYGVPTIDTDEADSVGLPVDGDYYVIGGENVTQDAEAQYWFLTEYGYYYEDKTFILHGYFSEDDWGDFYVTVADGIDYWVILPDGMEIPADGSYVTVTATFAGYGMIATSVETVDEPAEASAGTVMYVTATALHVRSTPDSSVDDNTVGFLSYGDRVNVLETGFGTEGNWCKIVFDCDEGCAYVSTKYLSETMPTDVV